MDAQMALPRLLLQGIGISKSKTAGPLRFFLPKEQTQGQKRVASASDPSSEWKRLQAALEEAQRRSDALLLQARERVGEQEAEIFRIHGMLLSDEDLLDAMRREIERGLAAEEALQSAIRDFSILLRQLEDPYLSARVADLEDIAEQVRSALCGTAEYTLSADTPPCILVADDLSPSQTVLLDRSKLLGFVTFRGSANSHTAILARAMGIPALVGVGRIDPRYDGAFALLNAATGSLSICPAEEEKHIFFKAQEQERQIKRDTGDSLRRLLHQPALTASGHRILLYANIGDASEVDAALSEGAEGIGLLRSEFLYLGLQGYPSEETLFQAYAEVATRMQGKRTVIRTLDVGADKQIPYFGLPREENPALGFRAIRVCLARPALFKTQLRAILRASARGRLAVMLPFVISPEEVAQSRQLLEECKRELEAEGKPFDGGIEFGIMIETPAAAILSRELAGTVDFFSIGTNDLLQYTLAADRQNPLLAELCDRNTEPILRLIEMSAKAIHEAGGWIGICGEMAADLRLTQRFADLGIDELSASPPALLALRARIAECR